jgi:hypothetical protein
MQRLPRAPNPVFQAPRRGDNVPVRRQGDGSSPVRPVPAPPISMMAPGALGGDAGPGEEQRKERIPEPLKKFFAPDRITIRLDLHQGRSVYTSILKLVFSPERLGNPR